MARIYNRETGRLFAVMLVFLLAALCVGNAADRVAVRRQREENQQVFAAFFGNVKALYPEVREDEWITLLNGKENVKAGRELLQSYGILDGMETFELQERYIRKTRAWMNGCLIFLFLALGGCFLVFLRQRQRRLDRLTLYLQEVTQGDYMLEIENQRDDELSLLQSELYKVVVLLREQARMLKEQKRALADSVSDISHQLKTPLTSVMVLVDNLAENSRMEEATRKHFLAEITAQLTGMAWLVAVMLKLSKLDAGVVELERKPLSAKALLCQVAEGLEQQAEWRGVAMELRIAEDAVICGDAKWLREALTNIVKNAIEHCSGQESVRIALEDNAVYTQISVQNFGDILSAEEQKHIFERFYQRQAKGDPTTDHAAGMENVGIGLSLAKEIIERQNGFITVESTEEKGTVFVIKFMKYADCH